MLIRAIDIPAPGVGSFTLTVEYDDSIVRVVDVLEGDSLLTARMDFNHTTAGQVHITGFYLEDSGPVGSFTLASLQAQATGTPGQCADLGLTIRLLADTADAELQAEAINGRVCILEG